ncbi:hypothetical protein QYE76_038435 [Lolium multiflorum]|uniref:DUF4219 domain-containing protein n=1 Tax=Lolium multiflorum TaxID=4521 RepID=A0AAD8T953_LOLMU|nr:hypothetical protein QYE76_038435 [Lolium multiflorum]
MEAEIEKRIMARVLAAKNGGRELAAPRSARDAGMSSTAIPLLTRSNYHEWSLLMRVILEGRGWWKAVETGDVEFTDDRLALEAILRAVPPEMLATLAIKKIVKEAWDTLKTLRLGAERVHELRAQTLRLNYEEIKFRPGESIDDFAMRLQTLANESGVLGDPLDEKKVVLKLLRIAPKRFKQLCWSIESLVDLNNLSIEELVGRLKVVDERDDDKHDSSSKLLLTEVVPACIASAKVCLVAVVATMCRTGAAAEDAGAARMAHVIGLERAPNMAAAQMALSTTTSVGIVVYRATGLVSAVRSCGMRHT